MTSPITANMQTAQTKDPSCRGCHLTPLCHTIHDATTSHLNPGSLRVKSRIILQKNATLFMPDQPFQHLYAIEQGAVKTIEYEADGGELIRGFYFSGEIIGYESIYSGRFHFSAAALSETHVCVIDYRDFLTFMQANPEYQQHVFHFISMQMNLGAYLVSATANRKLAGFLVDLSSRLHRQTHRDEFQLPMSRQDIGSYLRMTAETVSRICTWLQQKEIIAIQYKSVRILQPDTLRQLAEGSVSLE